MSKLRKWKVVLTFWPLLKIIRRLDTGDWIERLLTSLSSAPQSFLLSLLFLYHWHKSLSRLQIFFTRYSAPAVVSCRVVYIQVTSTSRIEEARGPETLFRNCWMWEAGWSVTKIVYSSTYVLSYHRPRINSSISIIIFFWLWVQLRLISIRLKRHMFKFSLTWPTIWNRLK